MLNYLSKIQELKSSPLFNLSLGSKELFHSNLLAYFFDKYKLQTAVSFRKILPKKQLDEIVAVRREHKNSDLHIEFANVSIIMEIKIKSLANKEQLENIEKKWDSSNIFLLFSPIPPLFNLITWKKLEVKDLINILSLLREEVRDTYDKLLLGDYITFISLLNELILSKFNLDLNDVFDIYGSDLNSVKNLRIHDLYLKTKFSCFQHLLEKVLDNKQFTISFNIVNGKGVLTVEKAYSDFYIGIMIDGERYNKFITPKTINHEFEYSCKILKDQEIWFNFQTITSGKEYPNRNNFNKYRSMRYTSKKIPKNMTIHEIIKKISIDSTKFDFVATKFNRLNT